MAEIPPPSSGYRYKNPKLLSKSQCQKQKRKEDPETDRLIKEMGERARAKEATQVRYILLQVAAA
jgi:hypothetical protein